MKKVYILNAGLSNEAFSSKRRLMADINNRIEVNKGTDVIFSEIEGYSGYTEQIVTYQCMSVDGGYFSQTYTIKVYGVDRNY